MENSKILVFSHIPKTAGTSLTYLLKVNFGNRLLPALYRSDAQGATYRHQDLRKDLKIYKNCSCITGHSLKPFVNFGEMEDNLLWFTFLREPIMRYISHYVHQQENGIEKYSIGIEEWGEKFHRGNWMVKMIAGEENIEKAIDIIESKIMFVGLTEEFDTSLLMMRKLLNIDNFDINYGHSRMKTKNAFLKNELITNLDNIKEILQDKNQLDIKLYEYVKQYIWPRQMEMYHKLNEYDCIGNKSEISKKINLASYKLKNNLIYKPYVRFFS